VIIKGRKTEGKFYASCSPSHVTGTGDDWDEALNVLAQRLVVEAARLCQLAHDCEQMEVPANIETWEGCGGHSTD